MAGSFEHHLSRTHTKKERVKRRPNAKCVLNEPRESHHGIKFPNHSGRYECVGNFAHNKGPLLVEFGLINPYH